MMINALLSAFKVIDYVYVLYIHINSYTTGQADQHIDMFQGAHVYASMRT